MHAGHILTCSWSQFVHF